MKEIFLISTEGTKTTFELVYKSDVIPISGDIIMIDEQGSTFMAHKRFLSPNNETRVVIRGTYKKEQQ